MKDYFMSIKEVEEVFPGLREEPLIPTPGVNGWFSNKELQSRPGKMNGMYGRKHSKETIEKMKANRKGKCKGHSRNTGENNPMYGKKRTHSLETKEKMNASQEDLINNYEKMTDQDVPKTEITEEQEESSKESVANLKELAKNEEELSKAKEEAAKSSREERLKKLKDNSLNC